MAVISHHISNNIRKNYKQNIAARNVAIDGTKIIDSDLAHDVYNEFMDLYDSGLEIGAIGTKIEKWRENVHDDVEFELFITSYALALWETGNLTDHVFKETIRCIENGASVKMWRQESGEKDAISRQKELDRLVSRISIPKEKPRSRKTYKKILNFIFQIDDVLTFQASDRNYYASILIDIHQYRGHCHYHLAPTGYCGKEKPSINDIMNGFVLGRKIGCTYDAETIKQMQPGVENFWKIDKKTAMNFTIGLDITGIEHKDLIRFGNNFEVIGRLLIRGPFKELGSIGYEDSFEHYAARFQNLEDRIIRFGCEKIPLKMIMK